MSVKYFLVVLFLISSVLLNAQVFDYIVAQDGSGTDLTISSAINKCPDNVRILIFVKKGTYNEKILIGSHSITSNKKISLIGEDAENTIIVYDDYNGKTITYDGRSVTSGTPQSATFTVNATDFYAENITIKNTYTAKQAVALYNVADRQTFKNCKLIGYQDTHYLKKGRRYYFYKTYIEGAVDYICAGGTTLFDSCTLHTIRDGGYLTAPEDITSYTTVGSTKYYYGFIFRNCKLTSPAGTSYYLGRPWQGTSSSVFISCSMTNVKNAGWYTSGNSTTDQSTFFAEYNSKDENGSLINTASRVPWSFQLAKDTVEKYYTTDKTFSFISTTYNPVSLIQSPETPKISGISDGQLLINELTGIKGYILFKNKNAIAFSVNNTFDMNGISMDNNAVFYVKSVGNNGNLSDSSNEIGLTSGISSIESTYFKIVNKKLVFREKTEVQLYTSDGKLLQHSKSDTIDLSKYKSGNFILKMTQPGKSLTVKFGT